MKIQLKHAESIDNTPEEIAKTILTRFGLVPRKKDGTAKFHKLLLELYERKKQANREKRPEIAVMPVEEMGIFSGIKRQTMYDYLKRWLDLQILKKTSFVSNGKVIIGYEPHFLLQPRQQLLAPRCREIAVSHQTYYRCCPILRSVATI